jgi:hypothetical protein
MTAKPPSSTAASHGRSGLQRSERTSPSLPVGTAAAKVRAGRSQTKTPPASPPAASQRPSDERSRSVSGTAPGTASAYAVGSTESAVQNFTEPSTEAEASRVPSSFQAIDSTVLAWPARRPAGTGPPSPSA